MSEEPTPQAGNGKSQAQPRDVFTTDAQLNIIAAQQAAIAAQIVLVRDYEDHLSLSPGNPTPAPPDPATIDLETLMQVQTAAQRVQASYIQNLEEMLMVLGITV